MNNLHYLDIGSGSPLVLIHGYCEHSRVWDPLITKLSKHHRLLIPDLPGFGRSTSGSVTELNDVALQLHHWLTNLSIQNCSMIGHSLGGYIVLAFEEQFPEFSTSYGLFHSTSYADSDEKKKTRSEVKNFIQANGKIKFIDRLSPALFYKANLGKDYFQEFLDIAKDSPSESIIDYASAMRDRPDRRYLLQKDHKSILFLSGKYDTVVPHHQSLEQANSYSHITFQSLENTGHMGMYEATDECIYAILSFLDKA